MITEPDFIDNFIATFLATYCAATYDFHCQTGTDQEFPVEDAEFLAEQAWAKFYEARKREKTADGEAENKVLP